ncbi:HNH endonuclease [Oryzobacter terrae]|uniref:HNH endonuclease n=1 Tax=Oryzobacter terrae TaxID=1620385 RepID=UPI003672CE3E
MAGVRAFRDVLSSVPLEGLSDRERVDLVAELERVKGACSAAQAVLVDAVRVSREGVAPRDGVRSVGSEVALARRESPWCGDRFVRVSRALVHELPETFAALASGVCLEAHVVRVVEATSVLGVSDRGEADRRLGPLLGRLGVKATDTAARRVAAELDAAAVVARMEAAVRSRRVTLRAAVDGMAYLTVLGPMVEVAGAHAALTARARSVVAGHCDDEPHRGRGVGAVAADTALAVLSGRAAGGVQPVEVHLVMTDRALLGTGDDARSVMEPARVPGHGGVPAPVARWWLREAGEGSVWLRRLYTAPGGRDLVAMDSRRRTFTGLLRRMLVLRDDVCTTPWCGAAIAHADHATPARDGGRTDYATGNGKCVRCNLVKEAPGWTTTATNAATTQRSGEPRSSPQGSPPDAQGRSLAIRSPLGRTYQSVPPPLLGWGAEPARAASVARAKPTGPVRRPVRRPHRQRAPVVARRARLTSRLERQLCRYLT